MARTRVIDDAGEKIGGARKDYRREAMAVADLDGMTPAERTTLVVKDNAWPKPDWAAMQAEGTDPLAAALLKIVRDRLPAKPVVRRGQTFEDAARGYLSMLSEARRLAAACRAPEDVAALEGRLRQHIGWKDRGANDRATAGILFSTYKGNASPWGLTRQDVAKARTMVAEGFPGDVPAWRRGLRCLELDGEFHVVKGRGIVTGPHPSEEAAWEAARALAAEAGAQAKAARLAGDAPADPERPHLDALRREGPERRDGHVGPEDLIAAFGFRGVEFGEWLPDGERQAVLDLGFDALHDLADAIGLDPRDISLGGTLAVAFGARGTGGAAAHYESDRTVLNLTRLRGAGSLAHEWAHALDHRLGSLGGDPVEDRAPRFASGYRTHYKAPRSTQLRLLPPEVSAAVDALVSAFRERPLTREEAVAKASAEHASIKEKVAKAEENRAAHLERHGGRPDRKWLKDVDAFLAYWKPRLPLLEARPGEILAAADGSFGSAPTSFLGEARKLSGGGDYWVRPTELWARALECMVHDRLEGMGRRSDYLVHGVEDGRFAGPAWKGDPYPAGEERARLNALFGNLVEASRGLHAAPEAEAPRPGR